MGDTRYYIDIGGWLYVSSYATLARSPKLKKILPPECGEVPPFLDRDGTLFKYILAFLRSGKMFLDFSDPEHIEVVKQEADYFGLKLMEDQIVKSRVTPEESRDHPLSRWIFKY